MPVGNNSSKALCNLEKQWCLENGTRWPQEEGLAQTAASSYRLGMPASNGRKMVKVSGGIWHFAEWCWRDGYDVSREVAFFSGSVSTGAELEI